MSVLRCNLLRPYLCKEIEPIRQQAHARFFVALQRRASHTPADSFWSSTSFDQRLSELRAAYKHHKVENTAFPGILYPRIPSDASLDIRHFIRRFGSLDGSALAEHKGKSHCINGRVRSVREAGKKLLFIDIVHNEARLQVMANLGGLQKDVGYSTEELQKFRKLIKPGDYFAFQGYPAKTSAGEFSLYLTALPELLSPSLHTLPTAVSDANTLARFPQLHLVLNKTRRDLLRLRHIIEVELQRCLNYWGFIKVTTPILAADTGGAVARPFCTTSIEYPRTQLKLRIAQELSLKKLVAADLGRVYEIGPVFRNEGIDATHNPEFTTCEFYRPYANLADLMDMTEYLFVQINRAVLDYRSKYPDRISNIPAFRFVASPWKRLPFLKTLADCILPHAPSFRFPRSLSESAAAPVLVGLFAQLNLPVPVQPTVPRLLDALGKHFLEPLCTEPTFITHYPAIMSPLAKSFIDPDTGHLVSARAELFVNGVEYANMYEEENDPFAQRQKFLYQARHLDDTGDEEAGERPVDEAQELTAGQKYYVKVLEMGLPPTGGWGAGIERLVMLFGGAKRIGDVLPFGTVRGVVAMGTEMENQKQKGKGD